MIRALYILLGFTLGVAIPHIPAPRPAPRPEAQSCHSTVMVNVDIHIDLAKIGIPDEGDRVLKRSGTGVVLASEPAAQRSIVATARHVVHVDDTVGVSVNGKPALVKPARVAVGVRRLDGADCVAAVGLEDEENDVAILVVQCDAGDPAQFYEGLPETGEPAYVVGAPYGFHPRGVFMISDGRVLGLDPDGHLAVGVRAGMGNSGSGVWVDNRLVGLVVMIVPQFDSITLAVPWPMVWADFKQVQGGKWLTQ
jgi:hypothetical protein